MPRRYDAKPAQRSKLLDSIYLLLAGLGIVGILITGIILQVTYDKEPWMPHGDRAKQLEFCLLGFGVGASYLYLARQSRRLRRTIGEKHYLRSLETLITPPWISTTLGLIGVAAGMYFLALFGGIFHVSMARVSDIVQLCIGIAVAVSGVMLFRTTASVKPNISFSVTNLIFRLFLVLIIAGGMWRMIVAGWRLVH